MAGMKRMKLLLVTLFLGAVISCGGGGGSDSDGYSNASLDGVYYGTHLNFSPSGRQAAIETVTFDGVGSFGLNQLYYDPGMEPSGGTAVKEVDGSYTVTTDGTVQFVVEDEVTDGHLGAGATAMVAARINNQEVHNLTFVIKGPAAGFSATPLSGDFHAVEFGRTDSRVVSVNVAGDSFTTGDGVEGRYTPSAAGRGTFTVSEGEGTVELPVWSSADGSLFVGASANTDEQKIFVGMKAGSGHTAASLKGTYAFAKLTSRTDGKGCVLGTLTFDGTSKVSGLVRFSDTETPTAQLPGSADFEGTYDVDDDGTFTIHVEDEPLDGVMSADGKTIAFAQMEDPDEQSMGVGVRR